MIHENGVVISSSTIQRILKKHNFKSIVAKTKPVISSKHIKKRLKYCQQNENNFHNTVFLDESTFVIEGGRVRCWCNSDIISNNISYFNEKSHAKVNVCGGIAPYYGEVFLKIFNGNMDTEHFHEIFLMT